MMHLEFAERESHLMYIDKPDLNCFIGIAAKNCNTTSYNQNLTKIRRHEKFIIHFETGLKPDNIFFLNQKHGDRIIKVESSGKPNDLFYAEADAMITNIPNFCLAIRTADCIPVMITDLTQNCIAAVHSGWKSTEKDICSKTVDRLIQEYGSKPSDMHVYLLPGIDQDDYEVDNDVASRFPSHFYEKNSKYFLNLKTAIKESLTKKGISESNIFNSYQGTFNFNHLYFSHRQKDDGRNLNFIYLK